MLLMDIRIEKLKIKNDLKDNNFLTELSNADDNESALLLYYEMMKTILKALFVFFSSSAIMQLPIISWKEIGYSMLDNIRKP